MNVSIQARRRVSNAVAITVGLVSALTVVWPTWFEALTGADPDGGDGSFERWVVRVVAVVALLTVAVLVRANRRRLVVVARWEGASDHG